MKIGQVILSKNLDIFFNIVEITGSNAYGCNLLNDSNYTRVKLTDAILITENSSLIKMLCKSDFIRLEVAGLFCDNITEKAAFLGVSDRTIIRINQANS